MADHSPTRKTDELVSNGTDPRQAAARYCAFCGQAMVEAAGAPERFGEAFCSEAHADEFATGVRAARVQLAAATEVAPAAETEAASPSTATAKPAQWKMALKMAACCGAPMLALVVLAGGGGALLGAAGAALPLLLALACPLGMFFMMRGMMKSGQSDKRQERDKGQ
jgi:hypothetical protein